MAKVREYQNIKMSGAAAGTVQYGNDTIIEQGILDSAFDLVFGNPVKFNATTLKYEGIESPDAETDVVGFLVRNVARGSNYEEQPGQVLSKVDTDVLRKGVIAVKVFGTPAIGGQLFVRILTPSLPDQPIGGIEVVADGANTIAISTAFATFQTLKEDFQGTAFIRVKSYR